MKQPIQPEDIRKGDLIRAEWSKEADAAYEFRAVRDRDTMGVRRGLDGELSGWAGADSFYLLDRPTPPVELPGQFVLGWIHHEDERTLGAWRHDIDVDEGMQPAAYGVVGWDLWDKDTYYNVTAFTEAVAVPKAALDDLRAVYRKGRYGSPAEACRLLTQSVVDLLAAVDEANGSDQ